ncbi:RDD family protein [Micromonospora sp. WMMD812]|uniref:RDD family protein n=1 Tax=Micromonospora sp. WMMD812 TaxID=3015152 RepID=UPI00248BE1DA|nr:RDD family protein [Micromonospora sp. WMMD812]WBB64856.1 RDD family protein [Micromonospora sp. WMMD812]
MSAHPPSSTATRPAARTPAWGDAGLVSGEAVELDIRVARLGSRVLALLLDVLAQLGFALVLSILVAILFSALPIELVDAALSGAVGTISLVLVLVGYPVLFERFNNGRTPGKAAVGLRVVSADGGPVGLRQSLTRALVGVAVEWPGLVLPLLSWVAGVTVMLTDRRGRRLGDLVAGTLVVHTRTAAVWRPVATAVPPLVAWAYTLDLSRLDDGLALAARQYLARVHQLAEPARTRLARGLWAEVAALTTPPPPLAAPETVYLAAVLGERHRRAMHRMRRGRSVAAALWPELMPVPPAEPIRPAAPEATPAFAARPPVPPAPPAQPGPPILRPAATPAPSTPANPSVVRPATAPAPSTPASPQVVRPATATGERPGA